jgi:beta-mannosidase
LTAEANRLDPTRPVIENSGISNDLASGDTHDYRGALNGGNSTYFDIYGTPEDGFGSPPNLVTEFGVDAPPAISSLHAIPEAAARLSEVLPRVAELHDYQYRLLKYYIEDYRIHKYSPNAGYFQFMWIDFSPQSFYGVYDYWGVPKTEGLGGGLRAMMESNQPVGIFMEHKDKPVALYAVNDSSTDLGKCTAHWHVSSSKGAIADDAQPVQLGPDSHQKIRDLTFPVAEGESYEITLDLVSPDGKILAHNEYVDPFRPQPRPQGYPERMDDELGMRLWWAGQK